jgi:hypothetical protein
LTPDIKVAREVEVAVVTRDDRYLDFQDSVCNPQGNKELYKNMKRCRSDKKVALVRSMKLLMRIQGLERIKKGASEGSIA